MNDIDMTGWPPLSGAAQRVIHEGAETFIEAARAQGRDAAAIPDAVSRFGRAFSAYHGAAFSARVTRHAAAGGAVVWLIEPPVGCSLCLIEAGETVVMVDSGFQNYRAELLNVIRGIVPDLDARRKLMLLTHADVDHCGLADLADEVWMSRKCFEAFRSEHAGGPNLRERDPVQGAYERMIKACSGYRTPPAELLHAIGGTLGRYAPPLTLIGTVTAGFLRFEAWEGRGGHVAGECVFVERAQKLVFTGDVFCNLKSFPPEQAAFNALAPVMMGTVDDDKDTANAERKAIFELLGEGTWQVFGGHGGVKVWAAPQ